MSEHQLFDAFSSCLFSMRYLLFLVIIIQDGITPSSGVVSGLIWRKKSQSFIPIRTHPQFGAIYQQTMLKIEQEERLDLHGRTIRLTFFQEERVVEFLDKDRIVSGICGDIWTTLSHALNFTLQPIRSKLKAIGVSFPNQTYSHLLHVISQNQTDVLPIMETYTVRLGALDFTLPLWKSRHRLYIQPLQSFVRTWMIDIFSYSTWCAILIMHIVLIICGYISQKIFARLHGHQEGANLWDHCFYNFANMCNQYFTPPGFFYRPRILELSLSIFCFLMYLTYTTLLITHLTKKIFIPPFNDVTSMMDYTNYDLVAVEGSLIDLIYKNRHRYKLGKEMRVGRYFMASTVDEMYAKCCSTKKKYAMLEEENLKKSRVQYTCRLRPVGESYLHTWMASGVNKKFEQKRAIDIGILKMHEFGLITALKRRWLELQVDDDIPNGKIEAINIQQVYMILVMFCSGIILSILLLIIENLMSRCLYV